MKRDKRHREIGMLLGTLIHTGKQKMDSLEMTVVHYDEEKHSKGAYKHKDSKSSEWGTDRAHWINI